MGLRGKRQTVTDKDKFKEPELITDIEGIIKKAKEEGWYSGESLKIEDVINSFGDIDLRKEDMSSEISGYFKYEGGKWVIGVNQKHNPKRQRFTMAHELGHYMLHKEKNVDIVDTTFFRNEKSDSVEFIANDFASKILMPEDSLRKLIKSGVKNIGKLADIFDVSSTAMKLRVISLGYKIKDNV